MLPYLVTSNEDSVALLELDDGRFRMLGQGSVAQFATGYQYLLVDRALAKYLKSLKVPQIAFAPAVVLNHTTGVERRSHTRVFVHQCFHLGELKALALDGLQMYAMNGEHFFVSPSLKFALEANEFSYLQFSEGLSGFARAA
ncbi:MAG: hypothetical protein ABW034_18595 [Steroidobacteraceae bacterium]